MRSPAAPKELGSTHSVKAVSSSSTDFSVFFYVVRVRPSGSQKEGRRGTTYFERENMQTRSKTTRTKKRHIRLHNWDLGTCTTAPLRPSKERSTVVTLKSSTPCSWIHGTATICSTLRSGTRSCQKTLECLVVAWDPKTRTVEMDKEAIRCRKRTRLHPSN